jgi:hypothetical protein
MKYVSRLQLIHNNYAIHGRAKLPRDGNPARFVFPQYVNTLRNQQEVQ